MKAINYNVVLTGITYIVLILITLAAGYLKILNDILVASTFSFLIGNFMGILIPSPLNPIKEKELEP